MVALVLWFHGEGGWRLLSFGVGFSGLLGNYYSVWFLLDFSAGGGGEEFLVHGHGFLRWSV